MRQQKYVFEEGFSLESSALLAYSRASGKFYQWDGAVPKKVSAGATPDSTGGIGAGAWIDVSGAVKEELTSATGQADYSSALFDMATASYAIRNRRLLGVANNKLRSGAAVSIVCVGDSITYGYDVNSVDKIDPPAENGHVRTRAPVQYPSRLSERLSLLTKSAVTVKNYGFSGDTAKQCLTRWKNNPACDVAHIMLGINDANGAWSATFSEYCSYMERLIRQYIDWGHGVVIHTPTAITFNNSDPGGSRYGQYARAIAETYGCPVFESEGVHQYCRYAEVYSDSTHFNKAGYAKYGDAVASFILAGSWVRPVRSVSADAMQQPGRSTEGIGWFMTEGAYTNTKPSDSYTWNGQTGGITAGTQGVHSFSFYLDCEAANIFGTGIFAGAEVHLSDPLTTAEGRIASNKISPKFYRKGIAETAAYKVSTRPAGYKSWMGALVGRGWKTVYLRQDKANTRNVYFNQLIIEPAHPEDVVQQNSGIVPAQKEILVVKYPVADVSAPQSQLPDPMKMPGRIYIPLPKGLYRQTHYWTSFYDAMKLEMDITTASSAGGAAYVGSRKLLCRTLSSYTGETLNQLSVETLYSTLPDVIAPSKMQYGWEDPNDAAGIIHEGYPPTNSPASKLMYLIVDFPDAPEAYYTIEVECNAMVNSGGNLMY
nr:GDSL-type esterase/lipase family protein [Citrobacter braakii]